MFRRLGAAADTLNDITRVENMVRNRFQIEDSEIILVSQDAGTRPGFPPMETNVIFWKKAKRYRMKLFSPVAAVCDNDLPVRWLLPALEDNGDIDCC